MGWFLAGLMTGWIANNTLFTMLRLRLLARVSLWGASQWLPQDGDHSRIRRAPWWFRALLKVL